MREGNVKLTLSVNMGILEKYKVYCCERGLIISKQIENFMKEVLKKVK